MNGKNLVVVVCVEPKEAPQCPSLLQKLSNDRTKLAAPRRAELFVKNTRQKRKKMVLTEKGGHQR